MRERFSQETMDGLELEMRLRNDPHVTARKKLFDEKIKAFAEKIKDKSKAEMIAELKSHNPAYSVALLEADSEIGLRTRYIYTFYNKRETAA